MTYIAKAGLALAAAALILSACTGGESVSTSDGDEQIATDGGGEGAAERTEADFQMLIENPNAVVGSLEDIELIAQQVLDSLAESPPSLMDDPLDPDAEVFVARLTSMLRLRLAGVALTDLGFDVDLTGTDEEINASVVNARSLGFEEFAQQRTVEENPNLLKQASPHCVTMIATPTQQEALDAAQRVLDGEPPAEVANEVNFVNSTPENGALGCRPTREWEALLGATGMAITQLEVGEASQPLRIRSVDSPTNELFIVVHVDEIRLDEADVPPLGPFAGAVLQQQMRTYEVFVAPQLGAWSMDDLAIR